MSTAQALTAHDSAETAPSPEVPSLMNVFCFANLPGGETLWIKCGRAKVNRDGSINVRLFVLPTNGELHLRTASTSAPGSVALPPPGPLTAADLPSQGKKP